MKSIVLRRDSSSCLSWYGQNFIIWNWCKINFHQWHVEGYSSLSRSTKIWPSIEQTLQKDLFEWALRKAWSTQARILARQTIKLGSWLFESQVFSLTDISNLQLFCMAYWEVNYFHCIMCILLRKNLFCNL